MHHSQNFPLALAIDSYPKHCVVFSNLILPPLRSHTDQQKTQSVKDTYTVVVINVQNKSVYTQYETLSTIVTYSNTIAIVLHY